jgi:hypothetical protein
LDASSIQTDPDRSRQIVRMIKRMIEPASRSARRTSRRSGGGILGRLDGICRSPGVQTALERLGLEAELAKL